MLDYSIRDIIAPSRSPGFYGWTDRGGSSSTLNTWFSDLSRAWPQAMGRGAKSLVILVCWAMWCERNRRIFDGIEKDWGRLVSEILDEAHQWVKAGAGNLGTIVGQSQTVSE
jgi:hypothetical protein